MEQKAKIKKVFFEKLMYIGVGSFTLTIMFKDDRTSEVEFFNYCQKDVNLNPHKSFDEKTTKRINQRLEKIEIEKWKRKYETEYMMDGTNWRITIIYENGKKRIRQGSNCYPDNFNRLMRLIKDIEKW